MSLELYHIESEVQTTKLSYSDKGEIETTLEIGNGVAFSAYLEEHKQAKPTIVLASDFDQTITTKHLDQFLSTHWTLATQSTTEKVRKFETYTEKDGVPLLRNEAQLTDTWATCINSGGKIAIVSSNKNPNELAKIIIDHIAPKMDGKISGKKFTDNIIIITGRDRNDTTSKIEHLEAVNRLYQNPPVVFIDDDEKNIQEAKLLGIHGVCCGNPKGDTSIMLMSEALEKISRYCENPDSLPRIQKAEPLVVQAPSIPIFLGGLSLPTQADQEKEAKRLADRKAAREAAAAQKKTGPSL